MKFRYPKVGGKKVCNHGHQFYPTTNASAVGRKLAGGRARVPNTLKIDPTRTQALRRQIEAEVKARFKRLKAKVYKLVVDEDAFGLKPRGDGFSLNAFCPTGAGGGVDPSCSPSSGGGAGGSPSVSDAHATYETVGQLDSVPNSKVNALVAHVKSMKPKELKELAEKMSVFGPAGKLKTLIVERILDRRGSAVRRGLIAKGAGHQAPWNDEPIVTNAFCPTGPGGGVDPSCGSQSGVGGGGTAAEHYANAKRLKAEVEAHVEKIVKFDEETSRNLTRELFSHRSNLTVSKLHDALTAVSSRDPRRIQAAYTKVKSAAEAVLKRDVPGEVKNTARKAIVAAGKIERMVLEHDVAHSDLRREVFKLRDAKGSTHNESWDLLINAFCSTGPGGGIDPSCSPASSGAASAGHSHEVTIALTKTGVLGKLGKAGAFLRDKTKALYKKLEARYGKKGATAIFASGQALSWGAFAAGAATGTVIYVPSAVAMAPGVAVAEVLRAVRGKRGTANEEGVILNAEELSEEEVKRLAKELLDELKAALEGQEVEDFEVEVQIGEPTDNAFCPTGQGGGIDPSCSPSSGGGGSSSGGGNLRKVGAKQADGIKSVQDFLDYMDKVESNDPRMTEMGVAVTDQHPKLLVEHEGKLVGAASYEILKSGSIALWHVGSTKSGTGTQIIKSLKERGKRIIAKSVVSDAEEFYRKQGFTKFAGTDWAWHPGAPTMNIGRWEAMAEPDQVKAFKAWLRTQIKTDILSDEDMWRRFAEAGWKKGAARAFDDVKSPVKALLTGDETSADIFSGTKDEFLRSAFNRPVSTNRVKLLAARSYSDLEGITEQMSTVMTRTLTVGLTQGQSPRDIARDLVDEVDGLGMARATTMARTEIIRAHAEGQLDSMDQLGVTEVGVQVEWNTAGDERVCDLCAPLEGVVLKIDEARDMLPRHPNAVFAGSTFVPYGQCLEAVRAQYSGPSIMLTAAGGGKHRTAVGPNHPVMTSRGLVKAADLCEGDKVLYDLRNDQALDVPTSNFDQVPTHEDIFESSLTVNKHTFVTSSGSDLHGDRVFCEGEVQAVVPARGLLVERELNGVEKLLELILTGTDPDTSCVAGPRPGLDGFWGVLLPSSGGMGSSDSWIPADDHFVWLRLEKIEVGTFTGLAFDYTTECSLYCNDGFVVKNCRCAWIPANVGEDDSEQKDTKRQIEAAVRASVSAGGEKDSEEGGWGPATDISSRRPTRNEDDPIAAFDRALLNLAPKSEEAPNDGPKNP